MGPHQRFAVGGVHEEWLARHLLSRTNGQRDRHEIVARDRRQDRNDGSLGSRLRCVLPRDAATLGLDTLEPVGLGLGPVVVERNRRLLPVERDDETARPSTGRTRSWQRGPLGAGVVPRHLRSRRSARRCQPIRPRRRRSPLGCRKRPVLSSRLSLHRRYIHRRTARPQRTPLQRIVNLASPAFCALRTADHGGSRSQDGRSAHITVTSSPPLPVERCAERSCSTVPRQVRVVRGARATPGRRFATAARRNRLYRHDIASIECPLDIRSVQNTA